jgi:hypothetical protein
MNSLEVCSGPAIMPLDLAQIKASVEAMLAEQLRRERDRFMGVIADQDQQSMAIVLDDFEDWCDGCGLPPSPHAMAHYLLVLHRHYGAPLEDLQAIAHAFFLQNHWDVHVPICAALRYCAKMPRVANAPAVVH